MARNRIGRNDDDYWSWKSKYYPTPTSSDTDDEDEVHETSTATDFLEATIVPHLEVPPVPTPIVTSASSTMSDEPPNSYSQGRPTGPPPGRPTDDNDGPPPVPGPWNGWSISESSTTFATSVSKDWEQGGAQASTTSSKPSLLPTGDAAPPHPTDEDSGLVNHGAGNNSNKTPMYAAAGAVPVVVIIVGFFIFFCLRKRRRQRQAAAVNGHTEEMKMQPKPVERPYIAPIMPPSPPPQAALPQYSPSTPSSSHPPTASSSQPVILGPIPSGNNGAYLTGMDTSDLVSMRSGGVSRQGTVVDRDPFADGRSLEEAPPPYRPSSLPPASLASTSRNNSVRMAAPPHMTSRTQLIERSPFDDPEDDEVSDITGPTLGGETDAVSNVSELSYQIDPVVGRSPF